MEILRPIDEIEPPLQIIRENQATDASVVESSLLTKEAHHHPSGSQQQEVNVRPLGRVPQVCAGWSLLRAWQSVARQTLAAGLQTVQRRDYK